MRTLIILLVTLFPSFLIAQNVVDGRYSYEEIDSLAWKAHKEGKIEECIRLTKAGHQKAKEEGNKGLKYASYTGNLGFLYSIIGDFENAEPLLKEALEIEGQLLDSLNPTYIQSVENLGQFYEKKREYRKAEKYFEKAIKLWENSKGKKSFEYASSIEKLGGIYQNYYSSYKRAKSQYIEANQIRKQFFLTKDSINAKIEYAQGIGNLGSLYYQIDDMGQAKSYFEEALAIYRKYAAGKGGEAFVLNNLALIYKRDSNYQKALDMYNDVLEIEKAIYEENMTPTIMTTLHNKAAVLGQMKKYKEAEEIYIELKDSIKKSQGTENLRYASTLNALAILCSETGRNQELDSLMRTVLNIRGSLLGNRHPDFIIALHNLGKYHKEMGNMQKSYAYIMASVAANSTNFEAVFPNYFIGEPSEYIGFEAFKYYNNDKPIDYSKLVNLETNHYLINNSLQALLSNKIEEYFGTDKEKMQKKVLHDVFIICKAVLDVSFRYRNSHYSIETKLSILRACDKAIQFGIFSAHQLNLPDEVFQFMEYNKSTLLLETIINKKNQRFRSLPDSLVQKEVQLNKLIAETEAELNSKIQDDRRRRLLTKKNNLVLQFEKLKQQIKEVDPDYYDFQYKTSITSVESIQQNLGETTLFLEYFNSEEYVYLTAIEKERITVLKLNTTGKELDSLILQHQKYLINIDAAKSEETEVEFYEGLTNTGYQLYQKLLAPILKKKKHIKNLILVPDGKLAYLSFDAFLTASAEQSVYLDYSDLDYLLKNFQISYNYAGTLWEENLAESDRNKKYNTQMLAVAPIYGENNSTVRTSKTDRGKLKKLLYAQKEVDYLAQNYEGCFLLDTTATKSEFLAKAINSKILHLAMHGVNDLHIPMYSYLAFTSGNLEAWEIAQLDLNAELAILSACETGFGKIQRGEGVMSLARAFMYAGVTSLIVSRWKVYDSDAYKLMKLFYSNLSDGLTVRHALQEAKITHIKKMGGSIKAHPYFWAHFVLTGKNTSIKLQ